MIDTYIFIEQEEYFDGERLVKTDVRAVE